ncbi:sensor histidine kinase [Jejuia spongiicola]|uniref:Histidine kinase n=1 Tax=Jejuia spongiicola TaxID=2942207 RepID=A0ABT0QFS9_9FLAO|nr:sensor histidine kinase [Jejuia spongiicola]MCL6295860.1 histidine kinase [Jejuia spongiicola]
MLKKVVLGVFLCALSLSLFAQDHTFKHYTTKQGLLSNASQSILTDRNGYLWIATSQGVQKFNGSNFKNFTIKEGLSSNLATKLYEDSKGRIWVATISGGANYIENDSVINLKDRLPQKYAHIRSFLEMKNGNIIYFTAKGIVEFDGAQAKVIVDEHELPLAINDAIWLDDNTIMAPTLNDGVHKITLNPFKSEKLITSPALNNISYCISKDINGSGDIWIGTYGELVKLLPDGSIVKYKFNQKEFNSNRIQSIRQRNNDELLLGLEGNGIVIFNKTTGHYNMLNTKKGIPTPYVHDVTEDPDGNIWGVDIWNGLVKYRDDSFKFLPIGNGLAEEGIAKTIQEGKDSVLMATSKGLYRLKNNTLKDTLINDLDIRAIDQISKDKFLISRTSRTYLYENLKQKDIIGKGYFNNVYAHKDRYILCGYDWFHIVKPDTTLIIPAAEPFNLIKIADHYLAGLKVGIFEFKDGPLSPINGFEPDGRLYNAMAQVNDHSFFVGDTEQGIYYVRYTDSSYQVKTFHQSRFNDLNGLNSMTVNGNDLWLGDISSLRRVDLNLLLEKDSISMKTFPIDKDIMEDGFHINGVSIKNNDIVYGETPKGLLIFNESLYKSNEKPPKLNLSGVSLFSEPLNESFYTKDGKVSLSYKENYLTFDMEAITYTFPENVKYKYRLKGLRDGDVWSQPVKNHEVVFSYLPPGNYTFEFTADNGNGIWQDNIYTYPFVINVPFWRRPLFWVLTIAILSGIVLYGINRKNKIEQKRLQQFSQDLIKTQEEERTRVSKDLHDSVGQQLTLIKRKAQNLEQEELSAMTNNALEEVRSISRGLFPAALKQLGVTESIQQLLNDLDEETDMFFSVEIDDIDNEFNETETLNLYRFIQETVTNALKHAKAKTLTVNITKHKNGVDVLIKDNGVGFDNVASVKQHSLGLKTIAERIRMLKGTLSIKSKKEEGTEVLAQIPIV